MFEGIKGMILKKQSNIIAKECIEIIRTGETFDDVDDMIATFIEAGYFHAIVYRHLQKREKDAEKIDWIVGNSIIYFCKNIPTDNIIQNRLVNTYLNARANLSLDKEIGESHEMYEELITDFLHEMYGKYIKEDLTKRLIALGRIKLIYQSATEIAKKIKI